MKRLLPLAAAPLLLAFTTPVVATWSAGPVRAATRAPSQTLIHVRGSIIPGWHVYSLTQKPGGPKPLSFQLEPAAGFVLGAAKGPRPQTAYDAEFKMRTETYSGAPAFDVPIRWTRPLPAGNTELRIIVRYMACSDKLCLPPRKETLTVQLKAPGAK
jgi:DsbC/DsbD-like thiol-disulfide interchange protein